MSAKNFKDKKSFIARKRDAESIVEQYPDKVPVIIERYKNEKNLPALGKVKFLVPYDMSVGSLCSIVRKRLQLLPSQSLFLLVNSKNVPSNSSTLGEVHFMEKDDDGFLYVVYASQEVFG